MRREGAVPDPIEGEAQGSYSTSAAVTPHSGLEVVPCKRRWRSGIRLVACDEVVADRNQVCEREPRTELCPRILSCNDAQAVDECPPVIVRGELVRADTAQAGRPAGLCC